MGLSDIGSLILLLRVCITLTLVIRKVDEAWDLKAQLVFGESKTRGRKDRGFKDLSGRVIVKGGSVPGH